MEDRRHLLSMLAGTAGATLARGGTATATAGIEADVRPSKKADEIRHPFGVQHIYYQGPTNELSAFEGGSLRLSPGMEPHPPHQHPDDEILLVTEGSGEIYLKGQVTQARPGSMMYANANESHGIKNTGAEDLLFYYFKWLKA